MVEIVIPGVVVKEEVGRGSYSIVYRAERAGRNYAVKVPVRAVAYDESTDRAFAREATILACMNHPNIAPVRAAGRTADYPYLILDFIEGESLESRIRAGPLDVAETVRIALNVASALSEAHRRGLVHQDVKPPNILIGSHGDATLLDFGLMARAGGLYGDTAVGTVLYSAPEQTGMLHRQVDARADLYALGAVLYHCLAGSPPFQASDTAELMRMHAVVAPCPLAQVRADIPETLTTVVARLLAKDPDDRYPSARDVVVALAPLAPHWPEMPMPPAGAGGAWATGCLVGRRRERALLRRAWAECLAGGSGVVTVAGQAGAGKTLLIQELLSSSGLVAGRQVLRGRCAVHTSVPFTLLRDLIDSYFHDLQSVPEPGRRQLSDRIVAAAGADAGHLARLHPMLARALGVHTSSVETAVGESAADEMQFRSAVVGFLSRLTELSKGMIIWIDDAHWLGPADQQVLEDLTASINTPGLMIINSTRDASLRVAAGLATSWEVTLGPLDTNEVTQIIGYYLGEIADEAFADEVAVRSSGNPLAVVEYMRAVIDAGLIRPDWGRFVLDRASLDSLPLPVAVLNLIRHRLDGLSPVAASVLGAAAVIGRRFHPALLADASASSTAVVARATAEAEAHQLVISSGGGTWSFVHDCVHEALLSTMNEQARTTVHRRIVDVLEAPGTDVLGGVEAVESSRRPYELARHAVAGEVAPERRFRLAAAAAAAALVAPAPHEAVAFYRAASTAAAEAGIEPDADYEEGFALACTRTVQSLDARRHFLRALCEQSDPRRRAWIFEELAWVEYGEFHVAAAREYVHRGLAEIGRGLPANPGAMAAVSVGRWVVGMACRWRSTGFGRAAGDTKKLHEIRCRLYEVGALSEWYCGRMGPALAFLMSAVAPSNRLGSGAEYLRGHLCAHHMAAEFGRRRTVQRDIGWLHRLGEESNDPALQTKMFFYTASTLVFIGRNVEGERAFARAFRRGARFIETAHFLNCYSTYVRSLVVRGCFQEAWDVFEAQAGAAGGDRLQADFAIMRARIARILGFPPVKHAGLAALDAYPESERFRRYMICHDVAELEVEDGEFGPAFDAVISAGDAVGLRPSQVPKFFRSFWIAKARGRLEQARAAPPGPERARRHRAARQALRAARWAAAYPPCAADLRVLRAVDRQLIGDHDAALDLLDAAERRARDLDLPRVRFDALLERARCLSAQGETERAETEADLAAQFARQHGWVGRERRVLHEFKGLERRASPKEPAEALPTSSRDRRRLDAVLRVSAAAGRQTAPEAVATVALDEIISILGADRALLLFPALPEGTPASGHLPDSSGSEPDPGPLQLYASRTRNRGNEQHESEPLDCELTQFATTVVEHVHAEQRPLVVTGTDEGAALGSHSAVQYGLRSILAAPVPFDGHRSGVIYVDSRVARGLFTEEDAQILITLAKQVGQVLRTAETSRLQAVIAAERHQREFAETLRAVTVQATSTLDTRDIPGRVLTAARRILPFDAAWVLTRASGTIRVDSTHGDVDDVADADAEPAIPEGSPLWGALLSGQILAADDNATELPGQRYPAESWLVAPLPLRRNTEIIIVLASRAPGCYGDTRIQTARTVIDQSMIAYRNAQLIEELRHHAATDPLTGLANRRQFFEQAERALARRTAAGLPTNAAMIDIDHFKRVNDTYGHSIGDEVLTKVTQRIRTSLRADDIIGRVGGEEFAALLPGSLPVAEMITARLRYTVSNSPIDTVAGPLTVRLSIGLTPLSPHDNGLADLLDRADRALYTAKRAGRDRVVIETRP
ncbi:diguanylate cyclase [Pseudofrankia sp. BMG5.36]|uniref:diguanylate cyclase n=1 Tax=Pseudofrankia sp. BMG5.36 TaxID=1834512 RepID=UPI0008D96EBC|nr:diguanylate cyclase [Pseudofrankia sp. BMG5.36]OHV47337.1 histidine kinase [Pseudofrankia sp. BMG5.36]